jgi:ABC-2 type transport system ATP-binding protein
VVKVEQIDDRPEYRISYDWTATSTNQLLGGIISLELPVQAFTEDRRHLNDAFMDLTSRGVR